MLKKTLSILEWVLFIGLIFILFISVSPLLPLQGMPRTYVVATGSMEPTIKAGSIIVTNTMKLDDLKPGEIITFKNPENPEQVITHRIASVVTKNPLVVKTKGDNNQQADGWEISGEDILGKHIISLPYLGRVANFIRQPAGFGLVVVLPALIIIVKQIFNIKKGIEEEIEKRANQVNEKKEDVKLPIVFFVFLTSLSFLSTWQITHAAFTDTVQVSGVSFSTGDWTEASNLLQTPTPMPTNDPAEPRDVVINEVYYQGTSSEEWIEIYNNSSQSFDLKDWTLTDNNSTDKLIDSSFVISSGEFVVVVGANNSDFSTLSGARKIVLSSAIGNGLAKNDKLILADSDGETIDAISWGSNTSELNSPIGPVSNGNSMAREPAGSSNWIENDSPNPGTNPHSHIQVDISQSGNDLIVEFDNASGFDKVKYSVFYDHQFQGNTVDMQIEGEKDKQLDVEQFSLEPLFIGSCSSEGVVCTPHKEVENMEIHLLYKNGNEMIGTSSYDFNWQN